MNALAYGNDCEYALYDMDHDGTEELIVSWGTSAADWQNTVYTVDDSGVPAEVGTFFGTVALYAAEDGNGIVGRNPGVLCDLSKVIHRYLALCLHLL